MLTEAGLKASISYQQSLQKKYSELYRAALRAETLLLQQKDSK
jgi:hypothetical protein